MSGLFKGYYGLDGGAMKTEFSTLPLQKVKKRLFQRKESNMVHIKDATKDILFQIAGIIVSHSLCQQAPAGIPVLASQVSLCTQVSLWSPNEEIEL